MTQMSDKTCMGSSVPRARKARHWYALVGLITALLLSPVNAQQANPLEKLTRFKASDSTISGAYFDLQSTRLGNAVLPSAKALIAQGGDLRPIAGGKTSQQVDVDFTQSYQTSTLNKRVSLRHDKDLGIIKQIDVTYRIESRYLSILPVFQQVLRQATEKYGEPLGMDELRQFTKEASNEVRLSSFIRVLSNLPTNTDEQTAFFEQKMVTGKTAFVADEQQRALLKYGFRQCYFWQQADFSEVLSFCSFQPSSGNMKGQGVTLSLISFNVIRDIDKAKERLSSFEISL